MVLLTAAASAPLLALLYRECRPREAVPPPLVPARLTATRNLHEVVALERLDVMPRANARDPLLAVWTCAREGEVEATLSHTRLCMRDAQGQRTDEARALRRHFGLEDG